MLKHFAVLIFSLALVTYACTPDDDLFTEPGAELRFSVDTLRFDTVFTELGSATRSLKIFNPYDQTVVVDRISLRGAAGGRFRLNVDGLPVDGAAVDTRILPNDSIYVFAEVTVDPDEPLSVSPFILEDEILVETNANEQRVVLEAFGQNAVYLPSRFSGDSITFFAGDFTFDDPKPYVIYGIVGWAEGTVTIPAGAQIYVHGGVSRFQFEEEGPASIINTGLILFGPDATLRVEGTLEEPVIIQGDRLEENFDEVPSQWVGFRLQGKNNVVEHATIKNSQLGFFLDSTAELSLKNTQIFNTGSVGLFADFAQIYAENCLFYNNGGAAVTLTHGGDYEFIYSTLASYGVDASALGMSNGKCYDGLLCNSFDIQPLDARFTNSIIFGSRADEISLSDFTGGQVPAAFQIEMENCIVRVDDLIDPNEEFSYPDFFPEICNPCINGVSTDALFVDPSENDYRLDTLSIAEETAVPLPGIEFDLVGTPRDSEFPDIGAFESEF